MSIDDDTRMRGAGGNEYVDMFPAPRGVLRDLPNDWRPLPLHVPTPVRKRVFDIVVGVILAVVFTPLMIVLALGSAIAYKASPLFVHRRIGRDGRSFRFMKLRSLPATTPKYIDKYELAAIGNNRWGTFLRKTHLDELPQLWLVAFGRMSLVGPRPEMQELSDTFDPLFVEERLTVRPGCTGLWQICDASSRLIGESPEFDLHYVRNWTLRLDVWILVHTAVQIVGVPKRSGLEALPGWAARREPGVETTSVAALSPAWGPSVGQ
jgi:lipopolysaccharide/colanic/teichoic acid biosynthesis glycosyltransferase